MTFSVAQEREDLVGVVAGDERAAASNDLVNVLLRFYACGCPGLDAESRHTVEFLLRRHIDRAVKCAEHTTAVCRGGVGVALDLAHVGEGIVDVAAVF